MSKYVYSENHEKFDIEDALTITKAKWTDGNTGNANRIGLFVASDNEGNEVKVANANDYICGVVVRNTAFLGQDAANRAYCVVQSMGVCTVRTSGSIAIGDKVMPGANGFAVKSTNNLGYRVVEVSSGEAKIIIAPNNDMIQRIKVDVDNMPVIRSGTAAPSNSLGKDGDIYIQIIE